MRGKLSILLAAWAMVGTWSVSAPAQQTPPADPNPTPIKGVTDKLGYDKPRNQLLGDYFENPTGGIAFRIPLGCKQIKADADGNTMGEFINEDKQWLLKVTRASRADPLPLQSVKDKSGERMGLLEYAVNEFKTSQAQAEVLRQEIINVGDYGVGIAIFRYNVGTQRFLRQQALFQASEKRYYVFTLTTPAAKQGKIDDSPDERHAAEVFKQLVDSIQPADMEYIRRDQIERLFRTRALFDDWRREGGKKLRDAIVAEQWLRLVRDGKDIGYSYVVEEFVEGRDIRNNPTRRYDGVLISIRTRTIDGSNQVDVGSQMYIATDLKREDWAFIVNLISNKGDKNKESKQQSNEYGATELTFKNKIDHDLITGPTAEDKNLRDLKNPPSREVEIRRIAVSHPKREGKYSLATPTYYMPSAWYIPQGVGAMLPRLVPLRRPTTYMFQSYVADQKALVNRYVDVGVATDVTLADGKQVSMTKRVVKAVPVSDRLKLEGAPITHYMSTEGAYLGSVDDRTKTTVLPSDAETLTKIWGNPDLRRADEIPAPENVVPGRQ